jgi:hypothetical protein
MTYSDALWGNASGDGGVKWQVAIFGEWNINDTRKTYFVKFQTSNAYLKTFSWQKVEKQ